MGKIRRFEDLEVFKLAMANANLIYDLSSKPPFNSDFALKDQIRRSSISVFSNIAEGFERDGNKELINFLSIAKGSCGEARAQAIFAHQRNYINDDEFRLVSENLIAASSQMSGFQNYLRNSEKLGRKFL